MFRMIVVTAVLTTGPAPAVAQEFPLWGELEPGQYAVGFESRWEFDSGRTYNTTFADGSVPLRTTNSIRQKSEPLPEPNPFRRPSSSLPST